MANFETELPKVKKVWILAVSSEGILTEIYRSRRQAEEAAKQKWNGVQAAIAGVEVPEGAFKPVSDSGT